MLTLQPLTLREARAWVAAHHRHHAPDTGALFAVAVNDGERVLGVVVIGRPKARALQDGYTAEVTRCCVLENLPEGESGHRPNVASKLYAAAWRTARSLGYQRLLTYTLKDESGKSLVAAGWKCIGSAGGGSWSRPSRQRVDAHPLQEKLRWEVGDVKMKIGFTGTRNGCTPAQRLALSGLLRRLQPSELHHGDCLGADDEAANLCFGTRTLLVCHPPIDETHRAFNPLSHRTLPPKSHFARNRDIVTEGTDGLIACPPYLTPITAETRGGTAYTVNYARKRNRRVWIVWPDGNVTEERG